MTANIKRLTVVTCITVFFLMASTAAAVDNGSNLVQNQDTRREFAVSDNARNTDCGKIGGFDTKVDERLSEKREKIADKRTSRVLQLEEKRKVRDGKLSSGRLERHTARLEHYEKLRDRVTNDEQKAAVERFIEDIEEAIEVRKSIVDAAISAYRTGIDDAVSSRKGLVETAQANFKSAVDAAISGAKADCEAGVDPANVRENLKNDLSAAREKLKSDLETVEKLREDVKVLGEVRRQAVSDAVENFKESIEVARDELRNSFE